MEKAEVSTAPDQWGTQDCSGVSSLANEALADGDGSEGRAILE